MVGAVVTGAGITGTVKVASVTSSTVYELDTAISATASAYIFSPIYGAPDLSGVTQTSGYYYICSEAGSATPNGAGTEPNTWSVGDWAIWNDDIGTGEWQKVDNSSVLSGAGTGQTVALWEGPSSVTDSETLGNAPITVSGSNSTFAGNVTVGALTSGQTAQLIVNQEGGVSPVAKFFSRTNKAIVQISDNDTTGYVSSENGYFSLGSASGVNAANINIAVANSNVGIGVTATSDGDLTLNAPKLHVKGADTADAYNLVARFQGGNDSDSTGAAILINHSNDRGLLIEAGRKDGDREVAYFNLISSGANITPMLTMGKFSSSYNVGIGTTSPTHLLNLSESDSNSVQLVIDNTNTTDAGTETSEIRFRHYRSYVAGQNDAGEIIVGKEQAWDASRTTETLIWLLALEKVQLQLLKKCVSPQMATSELVTQTHQIIVQMLII